MRVWIKRIVPVLLACLLLGSLVGNVVLYRMGREFYLRLSEVRLDPMGTQRWPAGPVTRPDGTSYRVVVLGDSRARAWSGLEKPGREVINRGVAEQTTAQVLGRFDVHVAPLRPEVVILQLGINDLKTIPLFPDRAERIERDCAENIRRLVEACRAIGAEVILATIFPTGDVPLERRPFWSDEVERAIERVNAKLCAMEGPGVRVMKSATVLAGADGRVKGEYQRDLLHLRPEGYAALNTEMEKLLSR